MTKKKQPELRSAFLLKQINQTTEAFLLLDDSDKNRKHFVEMLESALTNNGKRLLCGDYAIKLAKKLGWKSPLQRGRPFNKI